MKKKILVITPFFYPHVGGSEKYMEGLYAFLKKRNPEIIVDVLTYNTDRKNSREVYLGINIFRIPSWNILPGQFSLPKMGPLLKFLYEKRFEYDLIHCSTRFFDSSWWGPVYGKLIGRKVILTDHCAYHPIHSNPAVSLTAKIIDLVIPGVFLRLFDTVYSENKSNQRFLKEVYGIESKIAYPGVDLSVPGPRKTRSNRVKIDFIGRLIESKGIKNLFTIAKDLPNADFVLAGPGPLVSKLREKVRRDKIKNIKVPGSLSEKEVKKLLSGSSIFAYPTLHSEGLPLALLEAGKFGLGVVASKIGGIGEVIYQDKTGFLVSPGDNEAFKNSLVKLIENEKLRKNLGKELQNIVNKKFTWKNAADLVERELN